MPGNEILVPAFRNVSHHLRALWVQARVRHTLNRRYYAATAPVGRLKDNVLMIRGDK